MEESPEDIRLRNQQEVSILLSNLGQKKAIPASEIFRDVKELKMVAHLHESLEWLSGRIRGELKQCCSLNKSCPVPNLTQLHRSRRDVRSAEVRPTAAS